MASTLLPLGLVAYTTGLASADPLPISGRAFDDLNNNGVLDSGEVGVGGVTVSVYDATGAIVGSTTTAYGAPSTASTAGTWSMSGTDSAILYRVEYTSLQGYAAGIHGTTNATTVQFVTGGSQANLGLFNPQAFNGATSNLISGIQMNADPTAANTNLTGFTSVTNTPYSASGNTTAPGVAAVQTQTGTVFGIGVNRVTQKIYAGAYVKRHAGLGGANGDALGAIYEIEPSNASVSKTYTVPNAGTLPSNSVRGLTGDRTQQNTDPLAFAAVGKQGLGGVEVSDDGKTLWAVNMFDKSLYSVDLTSSATTLSKVTTIPDPGCANGEWRPMALKFHLGKLYAGGTCDAGTGSAADLKAVVFSFDPATNAWSSPVLSAGLDYPRAEGKNMHPWTDDYQDFKALQASNNGWLAYGQPMLGDIDFLADGSMAIAIRDRTGDEFGHVNLWPDGSPESGVTVNDVYYGGESLGELLRAAPPVGLNGMYTLESNASVNGVTAGVVSLGGPGGAEFYSGDNVNIMEGVLNHPETATGGLAYKFGTSELMATTMDSVDQHFDTANPSDQVGLHTGGLRSLSDSSGTATRAYELYSDYAPQFFGKANGLAELEYLTEAAPIEIGNRVWVDANNNGRQDPGELPLPGVKVDLYDNGSLISSTTTDAQGNYYFSGLAPNRSTYQVQIVTTQPALSAYTPAKSDATLDSSNSTAISDLNDSDGLVAAGMVSAAVSTGGPGENNHTIDFGFVVPPINLRLGKTLMTAGSIAAGASAEFDLAVTNEGPGIAKSGFTVTDLLPVGLTFVSASGAGYSCAAAGQTVTCTSDHTLAVGITDRIVVGVTVDSAASGSLHNVAYVSPAAGDTNETNLLVTPTGGTDTSSSATDNDAQADLVVAAPQAIDLAVSKTLTSAATVVAGSADPVTFSLTVVNNGPGTAKAGYTVTDTLPAGLSFSGTPTGAGYSCSVSGQVATCTSDHVLAPSTQETITVVALLSATSGSLRNVAEVLPVAGEVVESVVAGTTPTPGVDGAGTDTGATATNNDSHADLSVTPVVVTTVATTVPPTTEVVTTLAPTTEVATTVPPTTLAPTTAAPTTLAPTTAAPTTPAPTTTTVVVAPLIDLTLSKRLISTGVVEPGSRVTYELRLGNNGPGTAASGFTATDLLPSGLTPTSAIWTVGSGSCAIVGQVVTCTSSHALPVTASPDVIVVSATVNESAAGSSLRNVAWIAPAAGEVTESNPLSVPSSTTDTATSSTNNDGDAVVMVIKPTYSVGNQVWIDSNNNGRVDTSEVGIDWSSPVLTDT